MIKSIHESLTVNIIINGKRLKDPTKVKEQERQGCLLSPLLFNNLRKFYPELVDKKEKWKAWQPTPVFLSGESHGQRSLVGYSPRGCKESDTTEWLHFTSSWEGETTTISVCRWHDPIHRKCPQIHKKQLELIDSTKLLGTRWKHKNQLFLYIRSE